MTMQRRRVMAMARPAALPMPGDRKVAAETPPAVYDRWMADAAGVRAVERGDAIITIFEPIGYDWWTDSGVTAKSITAQLRAIGSRPVEIHINSPGGDMFEGIAIYNVLREHPQEITIKVMGMAASAASIVAMAGDRIEIGVASFLMIHNCWVGVFGNRQDLAEAAIWLEPFDRAMADIYAGRSGGDATEIAKLMDAETYMSGTVAIERGFADALLPADQMTTDGATMAADRAINEVRAMELTLVSGGMSRSQARARIKALKGTPGAALPATPGAGGTEDWSWAQGLLATLKS